MENEGIIQTDDRGLYGEQHSGVVTLIVVSNKKRAKGAQPQVAKIAATLAFAGWWIFCVKNLAIVELDPSEPVRRKRKTWIAFKLQSIT